jgi:multimeric flavodoxin WrbA
LIEISQAIMEKQWVKTEVIRAVDLEIATGIMPDMTKEWAETDVWPEIYKKVLDADILVITTPIWLGDKSSECTKIIERLYSNSWDISKKWQYSYYGRVGGCLVTWNEDGAKHCAMNILYSLQHIGYTIPPQADAAWLGEVWPGPSYKDKNSGGPENDFTNKNTTFMTWNLMHMAKMLKDNAWIPAYGNLPKQWEKGEKFDFENPEYR